MRRMEILLIALFIAAEYLLTACSTQIKQVEIVKHTEIPIILSPTLPIHASQTTLPTNIPTNTPTSTWTPLPTLTTEQAQKKINELNLNNNGCQLPCWWGIIPGKTTWFDAMYFLVSFTEIKQGENGSFYAEGKNHYTTYLEVYYENPGIEDPWRMSINGQDALVSSITVFPPDTEYNYTLHQILTTFGTPNQIYVSAQPDSQTNVLDPARIILDYGALGIWAVFEFPVTKNTKTMVICPRPVGARLSLWDPTVKNSNSISIEEFVDRITGFSPHKLEDVSEMSIQGFYNNFKNANPENCLETPIDLWP